MRTDDSYLGPIRSSARWHIGSVGHAVFVSVFVGLMAVPLMQFVSPAGHRVLGPIDFVPSVLVAALVYWLVRPTTYHAYIGAHGVLRTCRHGFTTRREQLMFKDAVRVETAVQRIIANPGEHSLYEHTNVTLTWYDEGGDPVFQLKGVVREPSQREDWTVSEGLDPAATANLPLTSPAGFAFAAKQAFEDYARQGGPYRSA